MKKLILSTVIILFSLNQAEALQVTVTTDTVCQNLQQPSISYYFGAPQRIGTEVTVTGGEAIREMHLTAPPGATGVHLNLLAHNPNYSWELYNHPGSASGITWALPRDMDIKLHIKCKLNE